MNSNADAGQAYLDWKNANLALIHRARICVVRGVVNADTAAFAAAIVDLDETMRAALTDDR